jgi:hypothetical protein
VADSILGSQEEPDFVAARWRDWQGDLGKTPQHRFRRIVASPGLMNRRAETHAGSITRAQEFAKLGFPLMQGDEGPGSRRRKGETLRGLISWRGPEGVLADLGVRQPEREPMLVFMNTPRNRILFGQLEMIVPDEDTPEEPLKVDYDPDAAEQGDDGQVVNVSGDDGQDALWFLVDSERSRAQIPKAEQKKSRHFDGEFERIVERMNAQQRAGRGF